jgi:type II secretory pathway pseudopilin PulG
VKQAQREHGDQGRPCPRAHDRGVTYVELLISIVLIGTAVVATLVAVRTVTIATRIDADQTRARTHLLTAADQIHQAGYDVCATTYPVTLVLPPLHSVVIADVQFAGRVDIADDYTWLDACFESLTHRAQLITLEYRVEGVAIAAYETVKDDR